MNDKRARAVGAGNVNATTNGDGFLWGKIILTVNCKRFRFSPVPFDSHAQRLSNATHPDRQPVARPPIKYPYEYVFHERTNKMYRGAAAEKPERSYDAYPRTNVRIGFIFKSFFFSIKIFFYKTRQKMRLHQALKTEN